MNCTIGPIAKKAEWRWGGGESGKKWILRLKKKKKGNNKHRTNKKQAKTVGKKRSLSM